jgi:hypothetical protein
MKRYWMEDKMNWRCGHTVEISCLGRGSARQDRVAKLVELLCESCAKLKATEYAGKLTMRGGSPLPAEMQAKHIEKYMARRQQAIYRICL